MTTDELALWIAKRACASAEAPVSSEVRLAADLLAHFSVERRDEQHATSQAGWTPRDKFAAFALAGQVAFEGMEGCDKALISGCAYELSDAMRKAREVKP